MQSKSAGFFLIEGLIASAILALFMVTVFQVLLVKVNRTHFSKAQDDAVISAEEELLDFLFYSKKSEINEENFKSKIVEKNFQEHNDLRAEILSRVEGSKPNVFEQVKKSIKLISVNKQEKAGNKDLSVVLTTYQGLEIAPDKNQQSESNQNLDAGIKNVS